jgi:hypothetical protein
MKNKPEQLNPIGMINKALKQKSNKQEIPLTPDFTQSIVLQLIELGREIDYFFSVFDYEGNKIVENDQVFLAGYEGESNYGFKQIKLKDQKFQAILSKLERAVKVLPLQQDKDGNLMLTEESLSAAAQEQIESFTQYVKQNFPVKTEIKKDITPQEAKAKKSVKINESQNQFTEYISPELVVNTALNSYDFTESIASQLEIESHDEEFKAAVSSKLKEAVEVLKKDDISSSTTESLEQFKRFVGYVIKKFPIEKIETRLRDPININLIDVINIALNSHEQNAQNARHFNRTAFARSIIEQLGIVDKEFKDAVSKLEGAVRALPLQQDKDGKLMLTEEVLTAAAQEQFDRFTEYVEKNFPVKTQVFEREPQEEQISI